MCFVSVHFVLVVILIKKIDSACSKSLNPASHLNAHLTAIKKQNQTVKIVKEINSRA